MSHDISDSDSDDESGPFHNETDVGLSEQVDQVDNDDEFVEGELGPIEREFGLDGPDSINLATSDQGEFFYVPRGGPVTEDEPSVFESMGKHCIHVDIVMPTFDDAGQLLGEDVSPVQHVELYIPDHMMSDNQGGTQPMVLDAYKEAALDALRQAYVSDEVAVEFTESVPKTGTQDVDGNDKPVVVSKTGTQKVNGKDKSVVVSKEAMTKLMANLPSQKEITKNYSEDMANKVFVMSDKNMVR